MNAGTRLSTVLAVVGSALAVLSTGAPPAYAVSTGTTLRASLAGGAAHVSGYVAVVATKCPSCGRFRIYRNGFAVGPEINTYSAATAYKQIYYVSIPAMAVAAIDVRVTSTGGKQVIIEGVGAFRT